MHCKYVYVVNVVKCKYVNCKSHDYVKQTNDLFLLYLCSISLFNSIANVFDTVIIELFGGSLQTTDMQFAYKTKHSTTLCTMVYLETLHHYVNNGSNVYSCLLDASKAFDRIHYGKLVLFYYLNKYPPLLFVNY